MLISPKAIAQIRRTIGDTLTETCTVIRYAAWDGYSARQEAGRAQEVACGIKLQEKVLDLGNGKQLSFLGTARFGDAPLAFIGATTVTDRIRAGDAVLYDGTVYRVGHVTESRVAGHVLRYTAYLDLGHG